MYKYIFIILAIFLFSNSILCENYIYISNIEVQEKNSKRKHWDSFYGKPDIVVSIYVWQNSRWLNLYHSPKFQNVYHVKKTIATEISVLEGQKIKFEVTDKDLKKSDAIGDIEIIVSRDDLSGDAQSISFGSVKNLTYLTLPYKNQSQKDSYNRNRNKLIKEQRDKIADQQKIIADYEKNLGELKKIIKEYEDAASQQQTAPKHLLSLEIEEPLFDEPLYADDVVVIASNKSIQNTYVRSGSYIVRVTKKGYETLETQIKVTGDGVTQKVPLQHKFRAVRFSMENPENGEENIILKGQELAIFKDNEQVEYYNALLPGHYTVKVHRDGYKKIQKQLTILPGEELDIQYIKMTATPRKIKLQVSYDVAPKDTSLDQKYLLPLVGSEKIDLTKDTAVLGRFNVVVEKEGYKKFTKLISIGPSSEPYLLKVHMHSASRYTLWKISSDFDISPNPNPDEIDISVNVRKKGYKAVEGIEKSLPTQKLETEMRIFLETLPRQVIANISADNTLRAITPDVISLSRILGGTEQESVEVATKAPFKEYKPGHYLLRIYKSGYQPIEEELTIFPDDKHYVIKKVMVSMRRTLVIDVTSNYHEGNKIKPDSILLDRQNIEEGHKVKPGDYTLVLNKAGYYPIEKIISVTPSSKAFAIKGEFNPKPREIQYKIFGATAQTKNVKVTIGDLAVRSGDSIPPKKLYEFKVECKGFVTHTFKSAITPADTPYIFDVALKPKKRRVILNLTAEFPKGVDLSPLDIKTLGGEILQEGTEIESGEHELVLAKTGYQSIREVVNVNISEKPLQITRVMKPKKRVLMLDLKYDVLSDEVDFAKTVRLEGKTIAFDKIITSNDLISPENYQLKISADGYEPLSQAITIHPAETPFVITKKLISLPRQVIFRITSDYNTTTNIQDCEIVVDGVPVTNITHIKPGVHSLVIRKPGFHSISDEIKISAGTSNIVIEKQLHSIPRVVKVTLVDNENGEEITPDLITLDEAKVTGTAPFKPKKYHMIIKAEGYATISEDINIEPGVNDYVIKRFPNSSKRLVLAEIKGDYNDKLLSPQQLTLSGVDIIPGTSKVRPGGHNLSIYVPGYEQLNTRLSISPSQYDYTIKQTLVSKKRKLAFDISSSLNPQVKIVPNKVLFNVLEVREGEELKPDRYYVQIEKDGYESITKMVEIEPSEDIYTLVVPMTPRARHLDFQVDSDYQPGVTFGLDEVVIDGKNFDVKNVIPPGDYSITLKKKGYNPLSFDVKLPAGTSAFSVKKTMVAKPRRVSVKVTSDFIPEEEAFQAELLTLAERDIIPEETFKPGVYEMVIYHPGYVEIREKIEVGPGEDILQLHRHLNPNRRRLQVDLTYNVKPTEKLGPHKISLRNLSDAEFRPVKEGDMIHPGEYKVEIEKEAYVLYEGRIVVQPDERAYVLSAELIAKHVQILIDIKYDVAPGKEAKSLGDYKVTFIDSNNIGRSVEHGNRIKPNSQMLEIDQGGYEFREHRKKINIEPSEDPFWIRETLYAKPRPLSFNIFDPRTKQLVTAKEVIINGEAAAPQAKFNPGIKYGLIAKFKKFKTVNRTITIESGEGPYIINVDLTAYKKYTMKVGKVYTNMMRDGVKFPLEIFIDGKQLDPHHIEPGDGFNLINYDFFAPQSLKSIRLVCGYYYGDLSARENFDFRDLKKIDIDRLEEHLLQVAKSSQRGTLRSVTRLLKNRQDKYKIMALSTENRQRIVNLLRDLTLNVEEQKIRKKVVRMLYK